MDEIKEIADRVFGSPDALDETDLILVEMVVQYVRSLPALGKTATMALVAIVALSESNPDLARSLMAELRSC